MTEDSSHPLLSPRKKSLSVGFAENTDNCAMTCVNTDGTFYCTCPQGYSLNNDGFTCTSKYGCLLNV
jgi:hypothetical protein